MKLTIFIIFIFNVVVARHHHHYKSHHHNLDQNSNSKENFFSITNENVQNTMIELFNIMNLTEHFVYMPKTKLLLTMLYDLNNIAGNNFDVYDVLKNITTVETTNDAHVYEAVREIINENQSNEYNKTRDKNGENNIIRAGTTAPTQISSNMQSMSEFRDSFLGKVKQLTVNDLFKVKSSSETHNAVVEQKNLKVWEPPEDVRKWFNHSTGYRRIYEGKKTSIRDFPFVVSIHIMRDFMCAGNIITTDLILTSASCVQIHYNNRFFRENPKTTFVRIGSDWATRGGDLVRVIEIYFYPTYDPKSLKNNLAILRIARTINFGRSTKVRRIPLDRSNGNLAYNTQEVITIGWGATKVNNIVNQFEKIQVTFLPIYPLDDCRKMYSKEFVTENNFCAGYLSKGSGACNRDVGGPGLVAGHLVGIISFGPPVCGAVNTPTVFTRVGNYIEWIENIMQMEPLRFGAPKTTKLTSKAFIYYFNTLSARTHLIIAPLLTPPLLRSHGSQHNASEEKVLNEIITDLGSKNNNEVYDIINEAFTEETINKTDVPSPSNKIIYFRPSVQNESPPKPTGVYDIVIEATTPMQNFEQPLIDSNQQETETLTPELNSSLLFDGSSDYDIYDNNNYEYLIQVTNMMTQNDGYTLTDSVLPTTEYSESKDTIANDQKYDSVQPTVVSLTNVPLESATETLVYKLLN